MPNHTYKYKGKLISVDVERREGGLWTWSYTIDGERLTHNKNGGLLSQEETQSEGEFAAEVQIAAILARDAGQL